MRSVWRLPQTSAPAHRCLAPRRLTRPRCATPRAPRSVVRVAEVSCDEASSARGALAEPHFSHEQGLHWAPEAHLHQLTADTHHLEAADAPEAPLEAPCPPPEPVFAPTQSPPAPIPLATPAAALDVRLKNSHTASLSALLMVQDDPRGERVITSASLDKSLALWRYKKGVDGAEDDIEVSRVAVPGGPIFSMAKVPSAVLEANSSGKKPKIIYCGTANKDILLYGEGSPEISDKVKLNGHTGWVRSLSISGKWLFSCGCNFLKQWDTTFSTPKECRVVKLFTGDILDIASSKTKVFTAGADGTLRSWNIAKNGDLTESAQKEKAHDGRVASCVHHEGMIYSASYDGSLKAWDAETLELVHSVSRAHDGTKLFCARFGADGILYTGGDDNLLRAWTPELEPVGAPLVGHGAAVRVLVAGKKGTLVSGDSEGDICVWTTTNPVLPAGQSISRAAQRAAAQRAAEQYLASSGLALNGHASEL